MSLSNRAVRRAGAWRGRLVPGALVVLVGLVTALALRAGSESEPPPAPAAPSVRPVVAQAAAVPTTHSRLAVRTAGTVRRVAVGAGDAVKAGDVLVELDSAEARFRLDDARANLALQQALLAQTREPAPPAEIAAARAAVASAEARLRQVEAGPNAADLTTGHEAVVAAQAALAGAEAKLRQAQAGPSAGSARAAQESVGAARAALAGAEARLRQAQAGASGGDLAAAEATLRAAEAQRAAAEQRLAEVRARPRPEDVRAAELAVEQARNALWAQQIARDGTCGLVGSGASECNAAASTVAAHETAVSAANEKLAQARQPATAEELRTAEEAVRSAAAASASARTGLDLLNAGPASWNVDAAKSAVAQAAAGVRGAEAGYDQLRAGPERWDVDAAGAAVEQAGANTRIAQARLAQLEQGPLPADVAAERGALAQAQATLEARQRGASASAIAAAAARVDQAQVALAQAEAGVEALVLRAPYDGVVTSAGPRVGETTSAGTPVVTLARLDELRFETRDLDEVSAARVEVGQEVTLVIAALEKRTLRGRVVALAPEPTLTQSGDVNYTATIALAEPPPNLRWGMTAKVDFAPR
ncbi:MAG TPA: HlyD family efflux transporter periplasmic adaptor subunit [Chloroflexota bacterium]|jgi:HlyD family secretion protein